MKEKNYTYVVKLYSNGRWAGAYRWDELFSPPDAGQKAMEYIEEVKQEFIIDEVKIRMSTSDGNDLNFTFQNEKG